MRGPCNSALLHCPVGVSLPRRSNTNSQLTTQSRLLQAGPSRRAAGLCAHRGANLQASLLRTADETIAAIGGGLITATVPSLGCARHRASRRTVSPHDHTRPGSLAHTLAIVRTRIGLSELTIV